MKLLVSTCNLGVDDISGIFEIDILTKEAKYIQFEDKTIGLKHSRTTEDKKLEIDTLSGTTGLTPFRDGYAAVFQGFLPAMILYFDRSYSIKQAWSTPLQDPHSMLGVGHDLYCVSSGNNCVYRIDTQNIVELPAIEILNKSWYLEDNSEIDTVHLNSITYHAGCFFISAFGKKSAERWSSARDGYIKNITTNQIVCSSYQPHSLFPYKNKLYFCESPTSAIRTTSGEILRLPKPGYTRGLAIYNELLFVGVSAGRKVSKSTSLPSNSADPEQLKSHCRIYVYKLNHTRLDESELVSIIELKDRAYEIYDICVIP
jgi:hypothetical protein